MKAYLKREKELILGKNWDQDAGLTTFSWHWRIGSNLISVDSYSCHKYACELWEGLANARLCECH